MCYCSVGSQDALKFGKNASAIHIWLNFMDVSVDTYTWKRRGHSSIYGVLIQGILILLYSVKYHLIYGPPDPLSFLNITMTGNSFRELPYNLFGSCSSNYKEGRYLWLDYLDLSNNNIHAIHDKTFHCTPYIRTLKLNDNNLDHKESSPHILRNLAVLEVLHLTNAFNFDKQRTTEEIMAMLAAIFDASVIESIGLKELHLENNYIGSFGPKLFYNFRISLEKLYLSHNAITHPGLPSKCEMFEEDCPLQEVYLNSNLITRLLPEFMQNVDQLQKMEQLDLSDNPFWCDCSFEDTYNWLRRNKNILMNSYRLTCYGPPKVAGKIVLSLNATDLEECMPRPEGELPDSEEEKGQNRAVNAIPIAIPVAILVAASCILLCVITVVCYRKKKRKIMSMCDVYCQCLPARRASECIISNPEGSVHM